MMLRNTVDNFDISHFASISGAKRMYLYIRETLSIGFHHGERALDTDLQKMLSAIVTDNIEELLLDIFKDA